MKLRIRALSLQGRSQLDHGPPSYKIQRLSAPLMGTIKCRLGKGGQGHGSDSSSIIIPSPPTKLDTVQNPALLFRN